MLDIETDSTILIDENAEKQRRAEFMQVLGGTLQQLSADGCGGAEDGGSAATCSSSPPRRSALAGSLEASIDELVDQ